MVDYKTCSIEDIIDWCEENGEIDWLKKTASKEVNYEVYPRVSYTDANGKKKWKADKSQKPEIKKGKISFIQIKIAFYEKFFPEMIPTAKDKKPSMYDRIKAL